MRLIQRPERKCSGFFYAILYNMKVLAIDPGYGRCGVAVVEKSRGEKEILIYSACIETSASTDFVMRLATVVAECGSLLQKHKPDCMAIEKLFMTKNQKTAMRVAEVRGALINCATNYGVEVFEYTPGEVKSATAGWGGADKTQIAKMLHALMRIEKEIEYDDEYDAIAIGVTHLARAKK